MCDQHTFFFWSVCHNAINLRLFFFFSRLENCRKSHLKRFEEEDWSYRPWPWGRKWKFETEFWPVVKSCLYIELCNFWTLNPTSFFCGQNLTKLTETTNVTSFPHMSKTHGWCCMECEKFKILEMTHKLPLLWCYAYDIPWDQMSWIPPYMLSKPQFK